LKDADDHISTDGSGRWMDDVFIERRCAASNKNASYSAHSRLEARRAAASLHGSTIATGDAHTRPLAAGRPTRSMLSRKSRSKWQHNNQADPP
jgi:hypothetical protein